MDGVVNFLTDQSDSLGIASIDEQAVRPTLPTPPTTAIATDGPCPVSEGAAKAIYRDDVIDLTDDAEPSSALPTTPIEPQENTATKRKRANDDHDVATPASKKPTTPSTKPSAKPGAAQPTKVTAKAAASTPTKTAAKPTNGRTVTPIKPKTVAKTPTKSLVATATAASPSTPTTLPTQRTPVNPALSTHTLVTPTPQRLMKDIPALSPRHQKSYISPLSTTPLKDPATFSLKPPYWQRWPTSMYTALAQEFRRQFDAEPFAAKHGKSVEEVEHLIHALIYEPVQSQAEKVRMVCEARVEKRMKLLNDYGEKMRKWDIGKSRVTAELYGVKEGVVVFVNEKGEEIEAVFGRLGMADQEYIKGLASEGDWAKLTSGVE
ncbi:hypothetical protein B0A48_01806 [Cryoendolithus antarcticus]|uniref:Uncharacterized protein n=1 Tax=Cryoendolithus antarcticus TaxID=1507870 RepID=A0A1V8TQC3_9PEZI|nr:hypothetical protein B0A48_01806 [Cryoendolithus antarcticus]